MFGLLLPISTTTTATTHIHARAYTLREQQPCRAPSA